MRPQIVYLNFNSELTRHDKITEFDKKCIIKYNRNWDWVWDTLYYVLFSTVTQNLLMDANFDNILKSLGYRCLSDIQIRTHWFQVDRSGEVAYRSKVKWESLGGFNSELVWPFYSSVIRVTQFSIHYTCLIRSSAKYLHKWTAHLCVLRGHNNLFDTILQIVSYSRKTN